MKTIFQNAYHLFTEVQNPEKHGLVEDFETTRQYQQFATARELLVRLEYIDSSVGSNEVKLVAASEQIIANRLALLKLASKFDRGFELPMRFSPGAFFLGAMVSPSTYGNFDFLPATTGVGGCGETFRRAFEGCCGEAAEFLSFIQWQDSSSDNPKNFESGLNEKELNWAIAGLGGENAARLTDLDWITAKSLLDDSEVKFPRELVIRKPVGYRNAKRPSESTGIGAGITLQDAVRSGTLEVIERDAIALWWFGGNAAKKIDTKTIDGSGILDFVEEIKQQTDRHCWFLDITAGIGIPTIAALSSEADGSSVVAGFSSNLTMKGALQRALIELCQMEVAQEISLTRSEFQNYEDLAPLDKIWIQRHKKLNVANFQQFSRTAGPRCPTVDLIDSTQYLLKHIHSAGFKAYYIDLTRNEIDIPVAKVLIPGLQSSKIDWISDRLIKAAMHNNIDLHRSKSTISPI
ncbi:MAG: YcaO-like family protein [Hyphomicrobiales bacterium]|nr:YcaO-like family protein [Hyphomicrobiales bacterium]